MGVSGGLKATRTEDMPRVRQMQDLIMRTILLDRKNRPGWLRQGRVATRQLPLVNQRRPRFGAGLHSRQSAR